MLVILSACCDKVSIESKLIFVNGTPNSLELRLFPKGYEIPEDESIYYSHSDFGKGFSASILYFQPYDSLDTQTENLYSSSKINLTSTELMTELFDSVHVIIPSETDSMVLRFSPTGVHGYTDNLFTDNEAWTYEQNLYELPVGFTTTYVDAHEYIFTIEPEKITVENDN